MQINVRGIKPQELPQVIPAASLSLIMSMNISLTNIWMDVDETLFPTVDRRAAALQLPLHKTAKPHYCMYLTFTCFIYIKRHCCFLSLKAYFDMLDLIVGNFFIPKH